MKAIHINSSAPFFLRKKGQEYWLEDFDILFTILSALMWRKNNGSIKLYTDSAALAYYEKLGLTDLWDGGINVDVLNNAPKEINQDVFWAAGKILALHNEQCPVAMIDTDLIVWKSLEERLANRKLAVFHREGIHDCYLPLGLLKRRVDYAPDPAWDWTVLPCNTAFAYFNDQDLLKYYTDRSIDFMYGNYERPCEMISQMVFAEQRILPMCAEAMGIPIYACLDDPFQKDNDTFTHLWGAKDTARHNPNQRIKLCRSLLKKIMNEFPEYDLHSDGIRFIIDKYF